MADRVLVRNAGSEKQVRRGAAKEKSLEEHRAVWLRKVMSLPEGRLFLASELDLAGCFRTPWSRDPYETSFNCGQQNVGLRLWVSAQDADPVAFEQMLREWRQRDEKVDRQDAANAAGDDGEETEQEQ